ncbi:hypothetical protein GCM10018954_088120 [Kutzneria kofuensis]
MHVTAFMADPTAVLLPEKHPLAAKDIVELGDLRGPPQPPVRQLGARAPRVGAGRVPRPELTASAQETTRR